jgi:hypothetical protein
MSGVNYVGGGGLPNRRRTVKGGPVAGLQRPSPAADHAESCVLLF